MMLVGKSLKTGLAQASDRKLGGSALALLSSVPGFEQTPGASQLGLYRALQSCRRLMGDESAC